MASAESAAASPDQEEALRFLADAATHGGVAPSRIDTHAAVVFLAGDKAYKLKRAVRYPFLDYSTPEKRRDALEAELAINRATAPTIYERIATITREKTGRLAIDGSGEAIDHLLVMRRFDETATLDRIVESRALSDREIDDLAHAVAAMHERAPAADADLWIADLADYIRQNDEALRSADALKDVCDVAAMRARGEAELASIAPLILARGRRGLVRRGHGDLHLGNIALIDRAPTPFDAIEFDERIAAGDVLYDLAFPLMDLCERGHNAEANRLLNRYLAETRRAEDLEGLRALPFYLHMRAAIRAKTTASKAAFLPEARRAEARAEARRYLAFADRALARANPRLVAIGGLSGTGKTTLAFALAPRIGPPPGAVIIRSDLVRKELFQTPEKERLPEAAYAEEASQSVFRAVEERAERALRAGACVICDAVYAKPWQREGVARVAETCGAPFSGVWLEAAAATRIERVSQRVGDASDADAAVARRQSSLDPGAISWTRVDAQRPLAEMADAALRAVESQPV